MSNIETFKNKILKNYVNEYKEKFIKKKSNLTFSMILKYCFNLSISLSLNMLIFLLIYIIFNRTTSSIDFLFIPILLFSCIVSSYFISKDLLLTFKDFINSEEIKNNLIKKLEEDCLISSYSSIEHRYIKLSKYINKEYFIENGLPNNNLTKDEVKELINLIDKKDYNLIVNLLTEKKSMILNYDDMLNIINKIELKDNIKNEYSFEDKDFETELEVNQQDLRRLL